MKYVTILLIFSFNITALFGLNAQSQEDLVDRIVEISLKNNSAINQLAYEKQFILFANETWLLSIKEFPLDVNFGILQVHSYAYDVTLSSTPNMIQSTYVNGTNIGLTLNKNGYLYLINTSPFTNVSIMIAMTVFDRTAPIPGGCNMEFPTKHAPYLRAHALRGMNKIEAAPAYLLNTVCGIPKIKYDWYHYFLPTHDYSGETYFKSISDLLTTEKIMENAILTASRPGLDLMRLYNAFFGNGAVYVLIASIENTTYQAAYVPYLTYSCSFIFYNNSCNLLQTTLSQILCVIALIASCVLCFFGSLFSIPHFIISSTAFVGLMTYTVMFALNFSTDVALWTSIIVAIFGTILFCSMGRYYVIITLFSSGLLLGFVLASTIVAYVPDSSQLKQSDAIYYVVTIFITLSVALIITAINSFSLTISSTLIGSILFTMPLDYYFGGHFPYIIINSFRRISITDFKYAISSPPFQWIDGVILFVRLLTALIGLYCQVRGCWRTERRRHSEITPLLHGRDNFQRSYGSDDVFY